MKSTKPVKRSRTIWKVSEPVPAIKVAPRALRNDTAGILGQEPHRLYWVRAYIEARAWRNGLPADYTGTRYALAQYIKTLRQNWAIERRFPSTYITAWPPAEDLNHVPLTVSTHDLF